MKLFEEPDNDRGLPDSDEVSNYFLADNCEAENHCSAHNDAYFFRPVKDDDSYTMSW